MNKPVDETVVAEAGHRRSADLARRQRRCSFKALLWDVDGTLAETGRDGHRIAFNQAFAACGLDWSWSDERYGELLAIPAWRERLLRDMSTRADAPAHAAARDALARRVHEKKHERYAELLRDRPPALRGGVAAMVDECLAHGVHLGVATATSRADLAVLLRAHWGTGWPRWFGAVVCGEDVSRNKPDPEVYVRVLLKLRLVPGEAVAIEDSPAGVAAARAVGVKVLVTRSTYFERTVFRGAIAVGPGLDRRGGWAPGLDSGTGGVGRVALPDIDHWASSAGVRTS